MRRSPSPFFTLWPLFVSLLASVNQFPFFWLFVCHHSFAVLQCPGGLRLLEVGILEQVLQGGLFGGGFDVGLQLGWVFRFLAVMRGNKCFKGRGQGLLGYAAEDHVHTVFADLV